MEYMNKWKILISDIVRDYCQDEDVPEIIEKDLEDQLSYIVNTKKQTPAETTWDHLEKFFRLICENPSSQQCKDVEVLGICCQIFQQYVLMWDDFISKSDKRYDRDTWTKLKKHDDGAVVYAALDLEGALFFLLRKYFIDRADLYLQLVDHLYHVNKMTRIAYRLKKMCTIKENQDTSKETLTWKNLKLIGGAKFAAPFGLLPMGWALILAGEKMQGDLLQKIERLLEPIGFLIQVVDDVLDAFPITPEDDVYADIIYGQISWLYLTAKDCCQNEEQRRILNMYGSGNEKNVQKIVDLYKELRIPTIYKNFLKEETNQITKEIDRVLGNHKAAKMLHLFNELNRKWGETVNTSLNDN